MQHSAHQAKRGTPHQRPQGGGHPVNAEATNALGKHFNQFIAEQVDAGRYASTTEVIQAALRLLEAEEAKLTTLRRLLKEGEESELVDYSLEDLLDDIDGQYRSA